MPPTDKSRPAIVRCELYTDAGMPRVAVRYDDHGEEDRPATALEEHLLASRSAERTQVEFRTADLPRKEPKIVYDGREVETPSSERATVGGEWMEQSLQTHMHRAEHFVAIEQAKISPDNALIAVLCDSVRLAREHARLAVAPLSATSAQVAELRAIKALMAQAWEKEKGGALTPLAYAISRIGDLIAATEGRDA